MYPFLLSLSLIATAIGVFAIGFGIPNRDFSLGDMLIIVGTVAVVGGMIMFGLAAAVRQLRRIADGMAPRPASRRPPVPEGADTAATARPAPAPRVPYPAKAATEASDRDTRSTEPRPMPAQAADAAEGSLERPRPSILAAARGADDIPMMEEPEDVPLVATRAPSPAIGRPPAGEPAGEPKLTPTDIMSRLSNLAAPPPRAAARQEPAQPSAPAAAGPAEPRQHGNMFDALWPAGGRAARQSHPEAIARAPRPQSKPEPKPERPPDVKPDPRADFRPEPKLEPRPTARPEPKPDPKPDPRLETPMGRDRVEPAMNQGARESVAPVSEPRPIAILKSGVIDGMAYTLYTDGSIEAELPQGTMRFASIDELRAHLEQAERSE
jgi:hypothetical protein